MKNIFQRELDGEEIRTEDPEYRKIIGKIRETMKTLAEFNGKQPFDENNKNSLSK